MGVERCGNNYGSRNRKEKKEYWKDFEKDG
jgi:hypothetical protein